VQIHNSVFATFFNFIFFGYSPMEIPVNVVPLWYLYMFAVAEIIFLIFKKLRLIHFIPVFSIISTAFFQTQNRFFKIDVALHGLIWFYFGYIFKKKGFNYKLKRPFLVFLMSLFVLVLVGNLNGFNDWRENNYGNYPFLSYVGELAFILITISLSNLIISEKVKRFFELFGRNTIFVLGYHIVLPGLIAPFFSDPITLLEKLWYLYYIIALSILYFFLRYVPKNIIYFLSGQFHLIKKTKSLPA
jgi:hypothetical protein